MLLKVFQSSFRVLFHSAALYYEFSFALTYDASEKHAHECAYVEVLRLTPSPGLVISS